VVGKRFPTLHIITCSKCHIMPPCGVNPRVMPASKLKMNQPQVSLLIKPYDSQAV
jgi:hypothetical protein